MKPWSLRIRLKSKNSKAKDWWKSSESPKKILKTKIQTKMNLNNKIKIKARFRTNPTAELLTWLRFYNPNTTEIFTKIFQ